MEIIFTFTVINNFYCNDIGGIFALLDLWTKTFRNSMELSAPVNFPVVQAYS